MTFKFGTKEWFVFIISILLLTDLAILLNILFLRQIFGFLFLTILPGLLILRILKLNKMAFLEKFILAWGLSISFLMFFGLVINNSLLSLGYETPLATTPLLISFNIAFIILGVTGLNFLGKNLVKFSVSSKLGFCKNWLSSLNLNTSEKAFLIVPILFPALSIFGMYVMNTTDNNIILMFMLFLISLYIIFVCVFNHKFSERLYPVLIFLISTSLLLLLSLRSNHLIGIDTHLEYYFFQTTLNNAYWNVFDNSALDACLSISLLPTIYQSILNISPEFLFKILYSLIYSISPLIIYVLSKRYVGEQCAFLASCFFMFQPAFLWTEYNARTNIAVLFFALAMMVLFSEKIDPLKKSILFIVFMASCMVSHYSTAYIFFFIMLGAFLGVEILSKKYTVKKVVSLTLVILFFSMIFFWYSQVTETAFNAGVAYFENTLSSLNKFFVEESRGAPAQALLGEGFRRGIPYAIQFLFTWLTFVFIAVGVLISIRGYKNMSFSELNFKKANFLKNKFEVEYWLFAIICSGLSVVIIALPFVSKGYGMERAYSIVITILSVFFVIGGITLSKNLSLGKKALLKKQKQGRKGGVRNENENGSQVQAYLIILLVLIPYFLCVTGVTHQMFGYPYQITLNSEGDQYDTLYVHDQESYSAKWLKVHGQDKTNVYTDFYGQYRLISQGSFSLNSIDRTALLNHKEIKGYIYLRYYNVVNDKLVGRNESSRIISSYNITECDDVFVELNNIYNNGGSEVYI